MRHHIVLLLVGVTAYLNATRVFQGDCGEKLVLCHQLCVTLTPETYECSCWDGHILQADGISCRVNSDVQYSLKHRGAENLKTSPTSNDVIEEQEEKKSEDETIKILPKYAKYVDNQPLSFKGSNYAEFPIHNDAYLETNITLQFKLDEHKDGILLFAGQLEGDDFISLTVDGPNIIMRHDCGEGTIEDMYHGTFRVGEWHEIVVWRRNCDQSQMRIDHGRRLVDVADEFKNYKGITMDEGVFIGGAPGNVQYLKEKTGTDSGFHGCIRLLIINGDVLLDANNNINQAFDSPTLYYCKNEENDDATKTNSQSDDVKMFDLTQRGLPLIAETPKAKKLPKVLPLVEKSSEGAEQLRFEVKEPLITTTFETLSVSSTESTTTTTTSSDSSSTTWKAAHFKGTSHMSLPAPNSILSYLELSVQFKSETENGMLFYWHENSKFLAVIIDSSYVKVYASLGADTTILRSENPISLYHWHKLEVWRSGKGILLKINKQSWVESELHGEKSAILEDTGTINIGSFNADYPQIIGQVTGFYGCVRRIRLNGRSIQLASNFAVDVTECSSDPCTSQNCSGNKCVTRNSQPICECKWPAFNERCSESLQVDSEISSMSFNGYSYLELDDETIMSHITGSHLDMAVNFKLKNISQNENNNQILVHAGNSDENVANDFIELSITPQRFLRFAIDLGSGSVVLTHPDRIEPDRWTTVEIIRTGRKIEMSLNGEHPITALAPEGALQLNVYHNVFIGNSQYSKDAQKHIGFEGCIISVRFDQTIISHPRQARNAVNINDCPI